MNPRPKTATRSVDTFALQRTLRWQPTNLSSRVQYSFLDRVTGSLVNPAFYASRSSAQRLVDAIRSLPDPSFFRVVSAPHTFNHVVGAARGELVLDRFLEESIAAEAHRAGISDDGDPCWSALGDYHWDGTEAWCAEVIGGIPVDDRSPLIHTPFQVGAHRSVQPNARDTMTRADVAVSLRRMAAGCSIIEQRGPSVAEVVRSNTMVVQLRGDSDLPDFSTSASCNAHIGRVIMLNAHLFAETGWANALVHEAIHSLLYRVEQEAPFLPTVDPRESGPTAISPWTGSTLHVHTYLHACLVWYGLVHFWQCIDDPEGGRYLNRAMAGFVGDRGGLLPPMQPYANLLAPGIMELLVTIDDELRGDPTHRRTTWEDEPFAAGRYTTSHVGETPDGRPVCVRVPQSARGAAALAYEAQILEECAGGGAVPELLEWRPGEALMTPLYRRASVWQRMEYDDRLSAFSRLARRLEGMHDRGLVHGTLCPEHILVDSNDELIAVDLGAAVEWSGTRVPEALPVVGHPAWAPLDQLLPGLLLPAPHWDLYALGAQIFWSITGQPPGQQSDPTTWLTVQGREVWSASRRAQHPGEGRVAALQELRSLRHGLSYGALVTPDAVAGLRTADRDALVARIGLDRASPLIATLARALSPCVAVRFSRGGDLADALIACIGSSEGVA